MAFQGTFAIITAALISGAMVERLRFGTYLAFIVALDAGRLRAGGALGVGRRLSGHRRRPRLRRRRGRARQRGGGGAGGRPRRRPAQGLRPPRDPAAQRAVHAARRRPALVRLVRLQRRQRPGGVAGGGAGLRQHAARAGGDPGHLDAARSARERPGHRGRRRHGDRRRPGRGHARGRLRRPAGGAGDRRASPRCPSYFALIYRARTKLDDSLDVVAAHGTGGATGALLTGVFADPAWSGGASGLLAGNPGQVAIQLSASWSCWPTAAPPPSSSSSWSALVMPLRISARVEGVGLDVTEHGEEAYTTGDGAILVSPGDAALARRLSDAWRCRTAGACEADRRHHPARTAERRARGAVPRRGARLTISRVQGHGGEMEHVENYRGTTVKMALAEKVRLEIGVSNHFVEPTVDAILERARTGEVGDGKISCCRSRRSTASAPANRTRTRSRRCHAGLASSSNRIDSIETLRFSYDCRFSLIGARVEIRDVQALIGGRPGRPA